MRRLWVQHDPMHFVTPGLEGRDPYDHQAYVTALCADEFHSVSDAEKIVMGILRHEFGLHIATRSDPRFAPRVTALAQALYAAQQARVASPRKGTLPPPAR